MRTSEQASTGRFALVLVLVLVLAPLTFADEAAQKATTQNSASPAPPAPLAPAAEKAANFTLPNAQDGMTRVKWPRQKPVFLTFGEQASQAAIQAWTLRVKEHFDTRVDYVGVAWLQSVPESMHPAVAALIKASYPNVLMDKTGSCAARYGCKAGAVNAYVIAPDGTILLRIHEELTDERFEKVKALLTPYTKAEK